MFLVRDIRETRVYQEAKEEGFIEGFKQGFREGLMQRTVVKLAARKMPPEEIAAVLEVDIELVRRVGRGELTVQTDRGRQPDFLCVHSAAGFVTLTSRRLAQPRPQRLQNAGHQSWVETVASPRRASPQG